MLILTNPTDPVRHFLVLFLAWFFLLHRAQAQLIPAERQPDRLPMASGSKISAGQISSKLKEVSLRSGKFVPIGSISNNLNAIRVASKPALTADRVLLQFDSVPGTKELKLLEDAGVRLTGYLPQHSYFASVPRNTQDHTLKDAGVIWVGRVYPSDRVSEPVRTGNVGSWATRADGSHDLIVRFFSDVPMNLASNAVLSAGGTVLGAQEPIHLLRINLPAAAVSRLLESPTIRWIEEIPPPIKRNNNSSRINTQARTVQESPYNLSGAGVVIGVWDEGPIDAAHPDLATRVIVEQSAEPVSNHATHVAGTLGGTGINSPQYGGLAELWKGVAPASQLISYDFFGDTVTEIAGAASKYGVSISHNSWGYVISSQLSNCSKFGNYDSTRVAYDSLIEGSAFGFPVTVVFSAGNERDDGDCGMVGGPPINPYYSNISSPGSSKNILCVGAINSDDNSITSFSSWGPVDDGRLKPEIVAPGSETGTDSGITSTLPGGGYGTYSGTSMAAPSVSGALALLTEDYKTRHSGQLPRPSTLRALVVHTADDLVDSSGYVNKGPDYASGYGRLQIKAAIDQLRSGSYVEGAIGNNATNVTTLTVASGTPAFKATLVWDDVAGQENSSTALVNDLDLIVIDPLGNRHYPWTLDPGNPSAAAVRNAEDHLNVIEQVLVDAGVTPGTWTIQVRGKTVITTSQKYALVFSPATTPPSITQIPNQQGLPNLPVMVPFVIGDQTTPASGLAVTASSSNENVIPSGSIVLEGSGSNRVATLKPARAAVGTAQVTLTVSDGVLASSSSFFVEIGTDLRLTAKTPIWLYDDSVASVFPSVISVPPGSYGRISAVEVDLLGLFHDYPSDIRAILVGPGGKSTLLLSGVGGSHTNAVFGADITLSDGGNAVVPAFGQLLGGARYRSSAASPGDYLVSLPFPAPSAPYSRFLIDSSPGNPEGDWKLYVADTVAGDSGLLAGGWRLRLKFQNSRPVLGQVSSIVIAEDEIPAPIIVSVSDNETPATDLILTGSSSNPSLIPNQGIQISGSGSTRTISLKPLPDASGTAFISLILNDGSESVTNQFKLSVLPVNDAPTISVIAEQHTTVSKPLGPVAFAIADIDTPTTDLQLTAASSNSALLPVSNIVFGGSGSARTFTLTPASGLTGSSTVSINVSDGISRSTSSFVFTVSNLGDTPPRIQQIVDRVIKEDEIAGPIGFSVSDAETPAGTLVVSGLSSNPGLLPASNIKFGGTGADRTVTLTPLPNAFGTAIVTISVNDGVFTTSTDFQLVVTPVNDPPSISAFNPVTTRVGMEAGPISFIVSDLETPAADLQLSASSSNPDLLPVSNIVFGWNGNLRTITLTPKGELTGTSTVTVDVSDGTSHSFRSFLFTVTTHILPPSISRIVDRVIYEDEVAGPIGFTLNDPDTPLDNLVLVVDSTNPSLLPASRIVLGGSGSSRTLVATPMPDQFGTTIIAVWVSDGFWLNMDVAVFMLTVIERNDAPTLEDIVDRTISENEVMGPIPVNIGDVDNDVDSLKLTVASSNPTLLPVSSITFGGSGSARTLTAVPQPDSHGTSVITVTVSDGSLATSDSFVLTVNSVNHAPRMEGLTSMIGRVGTPLTVFCRLTDEDSPISELTLQSRSLTPSIVDATGVLVLGTGTNRLIQITPLPDAVGPARIQAVASDGLSSRTNEFTVTFVAPSRPPIISEIAEQTLNEDTPSAAIAFSVSDAETPAENLRVEARSSNELLLPNANVILGGSGSKRSVRLVPAAQASGWALITLTVTDDSDTSTSTDFFVNVLPVNDAPMITMVDSVTMAEDTSLTIPFSVSDLESSSSSLVVSVASDDARLIANSGLVLGGFAEMRTLQITPSPNANGIIAIKVLVSDGQASTTHTLMVTVRPVNDPPQLTPLHDVLMAEDVAYVIPFSISDLETPSDHLIVRAYTSNPSLIPDSPLNLLLGGSGTDRTLTLIPSANVNSSLVGQSTIYIEVTDPDGLTTSRSFLATVLAVNDAPQFLQLPENQLMDENTSSLVSFSISDIESSASSLSVTATSGNQELLKDSGLTVTGTGSLRQLKITPAANRLGTATVTLSVTDGQDTTRSSFTVTVTKANNLPTITPVNTQVGFQNLRTKTVDFKVGDAESSADLLKITARSSNQLLIPDENIVLGGSGSNRTFYATPRANQTGETTIAISVSDGRGVSTVTFDVIIVPIASWPLLSPVLDQTTEEDTPLTVHFLVGDDKTPLNELLISRFSSNNELVPPLVSHLVLGGSGNDRTLTIIPALNANSAQLGLSLMSLIVTDSEGNSIMKTFYLTVTPVNDRPTISVSNNIVLAEDGSSGPWPVNIGDVETAADRLALSATTSNPELLPLSSIVFGGSGSNRNVTFTPAANRSGTAMVTLQIQDLDGGVATSTLVVEVTPVNDPPLISTIEPVTISEDGTTGVLSFTTSDPETPADSLLVSASSSNPALVAPGGMLLAGSGTNRTIVVNPLPNRFGTTTITLTSSDGSASSSSSFLLTVVGVDDRPTISSIPAQSVPEDEISFPISFTVSDAETQPELLVVTATSSNPNLIPDNRIFLKGTGSQRSMTLWPASNANSSEFGTASITVTVSDGKLSSSTSFILTVPAGNDAPVIQPIANRVIYEDEVAGPFYVFIGDVDTPRQNLVVTGTSSNPSLVPNSAIKVEGSDSPRTVTVIPSPDQFGTAIINITVSDGTASSSAAFTLTVKPVNDIPTISSIPAQSTTQNIPLTINFKVTDNELPAEFLLVSRSSSNVGLVPNTTSNLLLGGSGENRTLTIIPATNANSIANGGNSTIELVVSDGFLSAATTFEFSVAPINERPTVKGPGSQIGTEDTQLGPIPFTVQDAETPAGLLTVVATSSDQDILPDARITVSGTGASRTVTMLPATNRFGVVNVTLSASDGVLTGSSTFQVTFNAVNDPPVISRAGDRTGPINTPIIIPFTVSDPETPATALNVSRFSSNTGLIPHTAESMVLSGTGTNRTLTLIPSANRSGSSVITIIVSDGQSTSEDQFTVSVGLIGQGLARSPVHRNQSAGEPISAPGPWLQHVIQIGNQLGVQVYGLSGSSYRLEFTDDLNLDTWSVLPEVPGKDDVLFLPDPNPSKNQRFYRVRVE